MIRVTLTICKHLQELPRHQYAVLYTLCMLQEGTELERYLLTDLAKLVRRIYFEGNLPRHEFTESHLIEAIDGLFDVQIRYKRGRFVFGTPIISTGILDDEKGFCALHVSAYITEFIKDE